MDRSVSLEMDRNFRDFNLCVYWEPTLAPTCTFPESRLLQSAYLIRNGADDVVEFAEALARTIRPETFQAFQKIHGPRPIGYSDWYCSKLEQLFGILLYEKLLVLRADGALEPPRTMRPWKEGILYGEPPLIQRDEIERALSPAEVNRVDWHAVLGKLVEAGPRGLELLEKWLAERAARRSQLSAELHDKTAGHEAQKRLDRRAARRERLLAARANRPNPRIPKTRHQRRKREPTLIRDTLIRTWVAEGKRPEVCKRLDSASIPVTRGMSKLGFESWVAGWEDPGVRASIQTLITKALDAD